MLDFEGADRIVPDTGVVESTQGVPVLLLNKKPQRTPLFFLEENDITEVLERLGVLDTLLVRGTFHVLKRLLVLGLGTRGCPSSAFFAPSLNDSGSKTVFTRPQMPRS